MKFTKQELSKIAVIRHATDNTMAVIDEQGNTQKETVANDDFIKNVLNVLDGNGTFVRCGTYYVLLNINHIATVRMPEIPGAPVRFFNRENKLIHNEGIAVLNGANDLSKINLPAPFRLMPGTNDVICNTNFLSPPPPEKKQQLAIPSARKIKEYLDQYVVGQEQAKKAIAVAVHKHYQRISLDPAAQKNDDTKIEKSNLLILGPTGTGKTLLAQTVARMLDVPFVSQDMTSITETGYKGADISEIANAVFQAANQDTERARTAIVYLDEIDKITIKPNTTRDISGEGVQRSLLKLLEGGQYTLEKRNRYQINTDGKADNAATVDTTDILFICGGAFSGLEKIVEKRLDAERAPQAPPLSLSAEELRAQATPEDFIKFGFMPEMMGRLPVRTSTLPLTQSELVHALSEPKNAIVKQFQKSLALDNVTLTFTSDALNAVAAQAQKMNVGARGLRTILETLLLDTQFYASDSQEKRDLIITATMVEKGFDAEAALAVKPAPAPLTVPAPTVS